MAPRKISRSERLDVTPDELAFMLRRTDFLLRHLHIPFENLIANAYLQGVLDAAEVSKKARP